MKNTIKFIVLFAFILGSFYYTDHVVSVSKEQDEIMIQIKEIQKKIYVEPVNAYIDPVWGIIPGYNGIDIDVAASYQKMKSVGVFNEKMLVYKQVKPKETIWTLKGRPIFVGNKEKNTVSLMINVAWGEEYLPKILDVLDEYDVKASFFVDGDWLEDHKQLGLEIHLRGHDLLNHGFLHHDVSKMSYSDIKRDIERTNDLIYNITLTRPKYFTPPAGAFDEEVIKVCEDMNMKLVMFSADTIDWQKPSEEILLNRVLNRVTAGKILLMHPTEVTSENLDSMIELIQKKGLKIDKISTHLSSTR